MYARLKPSESGADKSAPTEGAMENAKECTFATRQKPSFGPFSGPLLSARGLSLGHLDQGFWSDISGACLNNYGPNSIITRLFGRGW